MNISTVLQHVRRISPRQLLIKASGMLIVIGTSLISIIILVLLLSQFPMTTLRWFFVGVFQNLFYFGNMINRAIPLMLTGLGITLAMKSSNFNLGGEGQVYAGAFAATATALALTAAGAFVGTLAAFTAAAITGGVMAGLSGFLKMKWRTNELISSFLLSNAVILVVNYLITGPFKDPQTNLLATRRIAQEFRFTRILLPSNLSTALFIALAAVIIVYFYIFKTRSGYEMRMCGQNREFARFGGLNVNTYMVLPMFLSGMLHGIGGAAAIFGTHHMAIKEFSVGMGWNGISVALIARLNPVAVIPAALFFAYIESGASIAMLHSDVTFEIASIVQAIIFFLVTAETIYSLAKGKRSLS